MTIMVDRDGHPLLPSVGEVCHAVKELEKANAVLSMQLGKALKELLRFQHSLYRDEANRRWILTDEVAKFNSLNTEELA